MRAAAEKAVTSTGIHVHRTAAQPFFAARQASAVAPAVTVSQPGDRLEQEADRMADKVMQTPEAAAVPVTHEAVGIMDASPAVQRKEASPASASDTSTQLALQGSLTGGHALDDQARAFMAPRFGADFQDVRIHDDSAAARLSTRLGARAFTFRNHVFFGDNQYQPGTTDGRRLLAHELTHTLQQGHGVQRQALVSPASGAPAIQRLGVQDALDYFADKAYYVPGFRLLCIALGFNPINRRSADRSAANLLRALVELLPGGALIAQALETHGVFTRAGAWVEQQLGALGNLGDDISAALHRFLDGLGWSDILDLSGVWDRAKAIFLRPIDQLVRFGAGVVTGLMGFVREAILRPLAALAEGTAGYDLLKAALGEDPITGDAVPRTPATLIGGFMKLIGQDEIWQNLQKANAVPRAWAWFQGALEGLMGFMRAIPGQVMATLASITWEDVVAVTRVFAKVGRAFVAIGGQFFSWAGAQVISLLEIIFAVVAPGALPYVAKAKSAFRTIIQNPVAFAGNLVRAGKLGFERFAANIGQHLKTALIRWITGPLGDAGVYIPQSFSLLEIVKLVLSVLGLTWQNIRGMLVKIIPDPILTMLEKTAHVLVTLVRDGPAAAWEEIKKELAELKDTLIAKVTEMVTSEIVKAAVVKLVSMLNPAGAVIQAILAIYNTITFFVQKIQQIAAVIGAFIDSISAIAAGQVEGAAQKVEQTMASTLSVVIAFLARFAGLGGIPDKLVGIVKKIRAPIDKGMDKIVSWLGAMLGKAKAAAKSLLMWWKKKIPVNADGESHTLMFEGEEENARLVLRSTPMLPSLFLGDIRQRKRVPVDKKPQDDIDNVKGLEKGVEVLQKKLSATDDNNRKAAGSKKASSADASMEELDKKLAAIAEKVISTLKNWDVKGADAKVGSIELDRGSFTPRAQIDIANAHIARDEANTQDLLRSGSKNPVLKGKLVKLNHARGQLARRHVVSSSDMVKHYTTFFAEKTVTEARIMIEQRASIPEARVSVASLKKDSIQAALKTRYGKFFNYLPNLFIGLHAPNLVYSDSVDRDHPDMAGSITRISDHIKRIKRAFAFSESMNVTGWIEGD